MVEQNAGVTQALRDILEKNGKGFMSLPQVREKMGAALKGQLSVTKSHSGATLKKIIEPHLGDGLEVRKKGNSFYLLYKGAPEELILKHISPTVAKGPGAIGRTLPFSKAELIAALNNLLKDGRIVAASLTEKYEARLLAVGGREAALARPTAPSVPTFTDRREAFRAAFDDLDRGKIFVRICELRRRLGWEREEFDEQLRRLRDEEVIQLHTGDVTSMTPDDVRDCFVDENGFRMGTVTWHGKR